MLWCCPACHGNLQDETSHFACSACAKNFPIVCGVPDLRIQAAAWVDFENDRYRATIIENIVERCSVEDAIYDIFRNSRRFSHDKASFRVMQVYASMEMYSEQLDDWLLPALKAGPVLDLGCGPGLLSVAAAKRGKSIAGLDVSIEWLVVAKHLIGEHGDAPQLAAGLAEALPVKTDTLRTLVSLDVIEHVGDQQGYVNEIKRVLAPGGNFAISTPNRFSLSPEPHVGVWGVGFLPVPLQAPWVKFAGGVKYEFTRLLSVNETKSLFRKADLPKIKIEFPLISKKEIAIFSGAKARLARLYNRIIQKKLFQQLAPYVGAYYRVSGMNEPPKTAK